MWRVAQRGLLQRNVYRSAQRRGAVERACYLATKSDTSPSDTDKGGPRSFRPSPGDRKRQRWPPSRPVSSTEESKRFFESTMSFLEQSSATEGDWTRENLELASRILRAWSTQTMPAEFERSWIAMADQLISKTLEKCSRMERLNEAFKEDLIPDSTVFCKIIATYSKSNLPDSAERANFWLQKMIETSTLYPNKVTPPRATLFANVLSAWEKSRVPDAQVQAEKLKLPRD